MVLTLFSGASRLSGADQVLSSPVLRKSTTSEAHKRCSMSSEKRSNDYFEGVTFGSDNEYIQHFGTPTVD